jgi:H+/Cl- antiporter ClcA
LVVAAILGVPISAVAYGFLALVSYLQMELFTHLPHGLGYRTAPVWWPLPMLVIGAVLAALTIRYLPGHGGASPAPGFAMHPPPTAVQLPGVILAALASLAFGTVIGPEVPLIALGAGLAVMATKAAAKRRPVTEQGVRVLGSAGAFTSIVTPGIASDWRVPADGGVRAGRVADEPHARARTAGLGSGRPYLR